MQQQTWLAAGLVVAAYCSGALPYGALIARRKGVDIQRVGSGNIGATNVTRQLGWRLGALVLVLDVAKGALPTLAARLWATEVAWAVPAVGCAAVVGHCFSVWLRFRGGKGVATALGVFVVIDPVASAGCVAIFAVSYAAFRLSSVGSLLGAIAFPFLLWFRGQPAVLVGMGAAIALLIGVRHHDNLSRLLRGVENEV